MGIIDVSSFTIAELLYAAFARKNDLFAKPARVCPSSSEMRFLSTSSALSIFLLAVAACSSVLADTIVIDGQRHEDVLIAVGDSLYYVSFPKTGETLSILKKDVSDRDIQIDEPSEKRDALFNQWKLSNARLKVQRDATRKQKEKQLKSAAEEKARQEALEDEKAREQERVLAIEKLAIENEKLGKSAEKLIESKRLQFEANVISADYDDSRCLERELDRLDQALRVRQVKTIADPTYDLKGEILAELESKLEKVVQETRDKVKRGDRSQGEPGYEISIRKKAAIDSFLKQGMSQAEAVASVEELLKRDMLPDPPRIPSEISDVKKVTFSVPVRKAAVIKTLIENGWAEADAWSAAADIELRGTLPNPTLAPIDLESTQTRKKLPVEAADIQFSDIERAYERISNENARQRNQVAKRENITTYQVDALDKQRASEWYDKWTEIGGLIGGLHIRWTGWVKDVDEPKEGKCLVWLSLFGPDDMGWSGVRFFVTPDDAIGLTKKMQLEVEATIIDNTASIGAGLRLSNVSYTVK